MSQSYAATFRWPHPNASDVIVTGTFDGWSCSHRLAKSLTGFEGTVKIPWGEKVAYKYIVDGRWTTTDDQPTELDPMGNLNNVFRAPAPPASPPVVPAPAPAEPAPKPVTDTERAGVKTEVAQGTLGAVNGFIETAKQAAVSMVEALAPGTAETPVPTPATETPTIELAPEPTPTVTPIPPPSEPEPQPTKEVTHAIDLPSEPAPVAPTVPVPILPLSTEPASDAVVAPAADVSETKPLDTTIVEGSATIETAESAPIPAPAAAPEEETPSTHAPVAINGKEEPKPDPAPTVAEDKHQSQTSVDAPSPNGAPVASPKPATNGAPLPATKAATINGKPSSTTPTKEKKMRFPSLSSRHSRTRSSLESGASELGEKEGAKDANGKDTLSSRFASSQRPKRRTSLFGKLKDAFSHHPKKDASESST